MMNHAKSAAVPSRPARIAAIVAVAGVALYVWYLVASPGLVDPTGHLVGRDFLNLHAAGRLISDGRLAVLFDGAAYLEALRAFTGDPDYPIHNWSYPPLLFPLAQAAAALPYPLALLAWQGAGVAAVAGAARMLGLSAFWGLLVAFSPAGLIALLTGQNGMFTAALMVAGLALGQRGRPFGAGLAWAVLAAKPHLGVCILPMLLIQRRFAVIAAGGALLALAIGATVLGYGVAPWRLFLTETAAQQRAVAETWVGVLLNMMPTLFVQGRLWGLDPFGAYALHAAGALLALPLLARALPARRDDIAAWLTWLVLGTFLLLPYSFLYDMVVYQLMLALWHRTPGRLFGLREGTGADLLWVAAWLLPVLSYAAAAALAFQPAPFFLLFLLWRRGCPGAKSGD